MSDDPAGTPPAGDDPGSGTPAVPPATPPAGDPPATPPAGDAPGTPPEGDRTVDPAEFRKVQNEAKNLRKRLKDFEDAEAARQAAQMSDLEKAQKAAADAEAERDALAASIAERDLTDAIIAEAVAQKVGRPQVIARLIDRSAVTRDSDGKPSNIADLVKAELDAAPELRAGNSVGHLPGSSGATEDPVARGMRIAYGGGKANPIYDAAAAREAGGGAHYYQPQPS